MQLAHACLASGFDLAVPGSWGDELVATETLRQLQQRRGEPAILCACPHVASRLLAAGSDLAPFLVSIVAPPVAVARYLRLSFAPQAIRLTYLGACPAGSDTSIDAQIQPAELRTTFERHGLRVTEQPLLSDSGAAPDRRRWNSLPGGLPRPTALGRMEPGRSVIEVDGEDVVTEIAQRLVAQEVVLMDLAERLGCACSAMRERIALVEPACSTAPVIDVELVVPLSRPVSASARPVAVDAGGKEHVAGGAGEAPSSVADRPVTAPPPLPAIDIPPSPRPVTPSSTPPVRVTPRAATAVDATAIPQSMEPREPTIGARLRRPSTLLLTLAVVALAGLVVAFATRR